MYVQGERIVRVCVWVCARLKARQREEEEKNREKKE